MPINQAHPLHMPGGRRRRGLFVLKDVERLARAVFHCKKTASDRGAGSLDQCTRPSKERSTSCFLPCPAHENAREGGGTNREDEKCADEAEFGNFSISFSWSFVVKGWVSMETNIAKDISFEKRQSTCDAALDGLLRGLVPNVAHCRQL